MSIRHHKVRFVDICAETFRKLINTNRFSRPNKSQMLNKRYSNKKNGDIGIGIVHNYPCFLSGGIRNHSQPYGKPALQTPRHASLRFHDSRYIVYASIQPRSIANDITTRLSALQKSGTISLHNTFSLVLADGRWTVDCCNCYPRGLLHVPHRFKIRSQISAPKTPEATPLNIRGVYRWVRDPFLLTGLIIMWLTPFMTVDLLVYTF